MQQRGTSPSCVAPFRQSDRQRGGCHYVLPLHNAPQRYAHIHICTRIIFADMLNRECAATAFKYLSKQVALIRYIHILIEIHATTNFSSPSHTYTHMKARPCRSSIFLTYHPVMSIASYQYTLFLLSFLTLQSKHSSSTETIAQGCVLAGSFTCSITKNFLLIYRITLS